MEVQTMNLQKCMAGHYYDIDRFQTCPHCEKLQRGTGYATGFSMQNDGETTLLSNIPYKPNVPNNSSNWMSGWEIPKAEPNNIPAPRKDLLFNEEANSNFNPADNYGANNNFNPVDDYGANTSFNPADDYGANTSLNPTDDYGVNTSFNPADDYGANTSFNPADDYGANTSFNPADDYGVNTSFNPADDYGANTSFNPTDDYGVNTSLNPADDYGANASFNPADDHGVHTSFNPADDYEANNNFNSVDDYGVNTSFHSEDNSGGIDTLVNDYAVNNISDSKAGLGDTSFETNEVGETADLTYVSFETNEVGETADLAHTTFGAGEVGDTVEFGASPLADSEVGNTVEFESNPLADSEVGNTVEFESNPFADSEVGNTVEFGVNPFADSEVGNTVELAANPFADNVADGEGESVSNMESASTETQQQVPSQQTQVLQEVKNHYPVAGWLVCIKGAYSGESFSIRLNRNFIGRSHESDIVLEGDSSVAWEKHAILIYEPRSGAFLAMPGESRELYYVNGQPVFAMMPLNAGDQIEIGNEIFLFVPLCGQSFPACEDGFRWEM
jgi:hypothetical protein